MLRKPKRKPVKKPQAPTVSIEDRVRAAGMNLCGMLAYEPEEVIKRK